MNKPPAEIKDQPAGGKTASFYFIRLGSTIPIVFFITTFICGLILGNYNHLSRLVSELGALRTKSQHVFSTGLLLCSALSVLFVIGLYGKCRATGISIMPVILLLSYSISIAGAGIFPLPLRLHLIMGMPSILLILSPLLSLLLWSKSRKISYIKTMSILSLFVMSLGLLAFLPNILSGYPGLKQRFLHVGWSIWLIYLSYIFTKRFDNMESKG